ncbi:vacuolar sorting-associated VTA1 like [Fusarium phyllophilum]|uniref:Vacuolar sorting-associated VTA1 like n=1 Tax=Fusarium phyllophilum TaxID=47803 RepID=A0A8H5IJ18_9HYPO|nr:vacuolar sorting-associated VTA1 like [Fusarium phyllophilum]
MAEPLPAALKIPEVSRFINRANQLRSIKPAIAYWCEYHAVNQIVGKSLHTTDDDTFEFTKTLIERLEATKTERADDDAIVDNAAGQAYVEQFAQQTFERAERTMRANKVTRQTADTFDAAATFFDLTREWGEPDPEVVKKIKFAKWNAARILKAIREGKDPNETNPNAPEPEPEVALDPSDPEVQLLSGAPRASVEDAPDAGELPSVPTFTDAPPRIPDDPGYFPPQPEHQPQAPEPFVPSPLSQSPTPGLSGGPPPPPPVGLPPAVSPVPEFPAQPATQIPPQPSPQIPTKLPSQFAPPPPEPFTPSAPPSWTTTPSAPHPAASNPPPVIRQAPAPQPPAPAPVQTTGFTTDQRDINQAQKHAKWAISALNFEDVPTAVQELRNALRMLGAQ